jgi:hypothetical protein
VAEQVRLGLQYLEKSIQDSANLEELLAGLRFEQRGELEMSWGSLFLVLETIMLFRV